MERNTARDELNRFHSEIEIRRKEPIELHGDGHRLGIERDSLGQLQVVNKTEEILGERYGSKRRKILQDSAYCSALNNHLADRATNGNGKSLFDLRRSHKTTFSKVEFNFVYRRVLLTHQPRDHLLQSPAADAQKDLVPFDKMLEHVHR